MTILFFILIAVLCVYSYGFIDPNLSLTHDIGIRSFFAPLHSIVFDQRPVSAVIFCLIAVGLMVWYISVYFRTERFFPSWRKLWVTIGMTAVLLLCSFSAFSYDIFNYITTAKVTFTHHENPYVVMPIEIPNEPYLAFTRAANKVALYGPIWIGLTALPHAAGVGDIWRTIVSFKAFNTAVYLLFVYFIYRVTKSKKNIILFAFNPLVLIEVLVSGHNDIVMMLFAMTGLYLWQHTSKITGVFLLVLSFLTKIPTLVLFPLLFVRKISWDRILVWTYILLSAVFFIFAPLREELYPWYAVWMISVAAFFDLEKHPFLIGWTICLSFALELRNIPYIYMGYYGGPGPIARTILTIVPLAVFLVVYGVRKFNGHKT